MAKDTVAILGRPNVGKSTLFNRLTESRKAIVDEVSGVTRDRHYGVVEWEGKMFNLIDTGGYIEHTEDIFEKEIRKQVKIAIEEASVILFVVDVTTGITDLDQQMADMLRKIDKKVITVVNKVDNLQRNYDANVFYGLGLGDIFPITSLHGSGTGDLLDEVLKHLELKDHAPEEDIPRFAVVGKPNVGKSSLVNNLIGEERNIVTTVSGTTRDSLYSRYTKFQHDFYLVDTAGLRRKGKVHEDVEFYSVMRAIRSIEYADVCLLMIDATQGIQSQDLNILKLIQQNRRGVVMLVNKWDLIEKDSGTANEYTRMIKRKIAPFQDIPIIFTSAIYKKRIHRVLEEAERVYQNRIRRISTSQLNKVVEKAVNGFPPPAVRGRYIQIKYATQLHTHAPSFAFFCNYPQYVREPYKRYIENVLRKHFDFTGVPIQIFFRKK
ncbi:MAG: ribosome biogenesis GTPase Der [Bacteroidales bacterium]|nr:ribosome biogenesis GTPase Der [Bacteroidales bacterium]MBS3777401.1 ribosome biogenesis GTPase Der [Bacteroidales bacterium]